MSPKTSVGFAARPGIGVFAVVAAVLLGGCGATSASVSDPSPAESGSQESPGPTESSPPVVSLGADDYGVNPGLCGVVDAGASSSAMGLELVVSDMDGYEPNIDTWGTAGEPNVTCHVESTEKNSDGYPVFYADLKFWISESADDAEALRGEFEDLTAELENLETVDGPWDSGNFDWEDGRDDEAGNIGFLTGTTVQEGSAVLSCSTVWYAPEEIDDPKVIVRDAMDALLTDGLENSKLD